MPSVAINSAGERIEITYSYLATYIKDHTKFEKYTCPHCNAPMHFRQGIDRRAHFAHNPNYSDCPAWKHYKNRNHVHTDIVRYVQNKLITNLGVNTMQDYSLSKIRKITDLALLCKQNNIVMALELQLTTLTQEEFFTKQISYQKMGIPVVWIFSHKNAYLNDVLLSNFFETDQFDCNIFKIHTETFNHTTLHIETRTHGKAKPIHHSLDNWWIFSIACLEIIINNITKKNSSITNEDAFNLVINENTKNRELILKDLSTFQKIRRETISEINTIREQIRKSQQKRALIDSKHKKSA